MPGATTRTLYVEPGGPAAKQAVTWRASDPEGSRLMAALAAQPVARWLTGRSDDAATVDRLVTAAGDHQLAQLVLYWIPRRDCGSYSAGGAPDVKAYAAWITKLATALRGRPAIVVLEPDSLSVTHCLSAVELAARHAALKAAVGVLQAAGGRVYVDAGTAHWVPADKMAAALVASGIEQATGYALNCAHYAATKDCIAYSDQLRAIVGTDKYAIIDTGRCGLGPVHLAPGQDERDAWCNPAGRGCGERPKHSPAPGVAWFAYLKQPGSSDGSYPPGAPKAGAWWPESARGLAARAVPKL